MSRFEKEQSDNTRTNIIVQPKSLQIDPNLIKEYELSESNLSFEDWLAIKTYKPRETYLFQGQERTPEEQHRSDLQIKYRKKQEQDAVIYNKGLRSVGLSNMSDEEAKKNPDIVKENMRKAKLNTAITAASIIPAAKGLYLLKGISVPLYYTTNVGLTGISAYDWYKNGANFTNVSGTLLGTGGLTLEAASEFPRFVSVANNIIPKLTGYTKKVYHGSKEGNIFLPREARVASEYNVGFHVAEDPKISKSFYDDVMKLYIKPADTETIDVIGNDVNQFNPNYVLNAGEHQASGNNLFLILLLKKQNVNPNFYLNKDNIPIFSINKPVNINLLQEVYPNISSRARSSIKRLITTYNDLLKKHDPEDIASRLKIINNTASNIASRYGYNVIKYNNIENAEGGGGISYFITNPNAIYNPITGQWNMFISKVPIITLSNNYGRRKV